MITAFLVFMIAIFAETNRLPFDLPEAEQELAGGYNTEYSSMKFALYFLGEYAAMITGSAVVGDVIFWRLAFSGHTRWLPRMDFRPDQHRSLFHKGRCRDFLVYVGALDAPAFSLGSADAAGLAFLFRNRIGEHFFGGGNSSLQFETMNLETRKPRRIE